MLRSKVSFDVNERRFGESAQSLEMESSSGVDIVNCPKGIVGKSLQSLQNSQILEREELFIGRTLVDVSAVAGVEVQHVNAILLISHLHFTRSLRLVSANPSLPPIW